MFTSDDLALALVVAKYPDPLLALRASQVFDFADVPVITKALRMTALMHRADFLAATQCKILFRIIFVPRLGYSLVNPQIISTGQGICETSVRCASFPFREFTVRRPDWAMIQAQTEFGEKVFHEVEHAECVHTLLAMEYLEGRTLASDLPFLKRLKLRRQQQKK